MRKENAVYQTGLYNLGRNIRKGITSLGVAAALIATGCREKEETYNIHTSTSTNITNIITNTPSKDRSAPQYESNLSSGIVFTNIPLTNYENLRRSLESLKGSIQSYEQTNQNLRAELEDLRKERREGLTNQAYCYPVQKCQTNVLKDKKALSSGQARIK